MSLVFHISSGIAILATLMAILSRHAVHALLYFVLSTLALAIGLSELGASFAAVLEVIIYAGAIMVLFVFVVMLLNPGRDLSQRNLVLPIVMAGILLAELLIKSSPKAKSLTLNHQDLLVSLFREYGTLVELVSFVLLGGLLVAYRVGKK